jgi:glutamate synthase (NADPH/NADH) large chain
MPVRICTGEGGCPPRLLRSRFLKYVILQIASGYLAGTKSFTPYPR